MGRIKKIQPRQILDSRGNPTIEVDVWTDTGLLGRASVPSGASTGTREALEMRDGDKSYYKGKSVLKAIGHIEKELAPKLLNLDICDQRKIDELMLNLDGTPDKSKLGANALLALSLAVARGGALVKQKPLYRYLFEDLKSPNPKGYLRMPLPLMNVINGGAHASNNLDIQEFMLVPNLKKPFKENLRAGVEVFHSLKDLLHKKNYSTNVGDEGGFAPDLKSHSEAIELLVEAIEKAGYKAGQDILVSLDVAASEFYDGKNYKMQGKTLSTDQMIEYFSDFVDKYPIFSIEDGLAEGDGDGWVKLNAKLGQKILTIGDDLFVTNKKILQVGIDKKQANSILIKVNQIGTLSETMDTLDLAFKNKMQAVISHRSGETADAFIADLAVASGAGFIKTGSASRSDRVEKYNQLLRIEEELGTKAVFEGT